MQANYAKKKKKQKKSIFGGNSKKINKNNSESKSTAINLPNINKKWVKMTKEYQLKNKKQQDKIEVIE